MTPLPRWDKRNLERHTDSRRLRDGDCFEKLLGLSSPLEPEHLRAKSESVVTSPCMVYQAIKEDRGQLRVYFIDDDMVLAATNVARTRFITCYHIHPRYRSCPGKPAGRNDLALRLSDHRKKICRDHRTKVEFDRFRP